MDDSPEAAQMLSDQIERKINSVRINIDQLQDNLDDMVSASHFGGVMLKFLPDIERLSALPTGPAFAFDMILVLSGNMNAHGNGGESGDPADLSARRDFNIKVDSAMVEVLRRRFADKGDDWSILKEVKKIEKTAAALKQYGVAPYFPKSLDLMRREIEYRGASGPLPQQHQQGSPVVNQQPSSQPPRYH